MNPLFAFANSRIATRHVWGQSDCLTFVADWVQLLHGVDPAADLRLTYGSFAECQRVTGFFTNPLGVVRPRMTACGFAEGGPAVQGDVGILLQIISAQVTRPFGAVCMGHQWATLSDQGLMVLDAQKVVAVWPMGFDPRRPLDIAGAVHA